MLVGFTRSVKRSTKLRCFARDFFNGVSSFFGSLVGACKQGVKREMGHAFRHAFGVVVDRPHSVESVEIRRTGATLVRSGHGVPEIDHFISVGIGRYLTLHTHQDVLSGISRDRHGMPNKRQYAFRDTDNDGLCIPGFCRFSACLCEGLAAPHPRCAPRPSAPPRDLRPARAPHAS